MSLRDLVRLFRDYVRRIEGEIEPQVLRLSEAAQREDDHVVVQSRRFERPDILAVAGLLSEKLAAANGERGKARKEQAVREVTAAAALNYVNKIFFLKYCEDRHLPGLFRIIAEMDLDPVASPKSQACAGAFVSLLKRRISRAGGWNDGLEAEYRQLVLELKRGVLDRRSWFELIQAAFLAAEHSFPVIYKPTPYDYLCPSDDTIVDMLCELREKDFSTLDHEMVGSIYQDILRNEQCRQKVLGAFYTPPKTVAYMVSRLALERQHITLEPACGSGHFVEQIYRAYVRAWQNEGYPENEAVSEIIGKHLIAFDVDDFAAQLAAMRLFFLLDDPMATVPNIFVRDTLDMNVGAGQGAFMDAEGRTIFDAFEATDTRAKLSHAADLDAVRFDRIIGNPPYGGKPTPERLAAYRRLYRQAPGLYNHPLGSNETFGFFVANAIHRAKEGGIICFIVSDSILSIDSHSALRRLILSTCKIREILLAPVDLFRPVAIPRTCILTLEKATGPENAEARNRNVMRLVDRVATEDEYDTPPKHLVESRGQSDYDRVPRNPFFIRVHRDVLALFETHPKTVGDVTEGGAGLQTGDNSRYLALLAGSAGAMEQAEKVSGRAIADQPPLKRVYRIISPAEVVDFSEAPIPPAGEGFSDDEPHFVPFVRGSSRHRYVAPVDRYIDYSERALAEYQASASAVVRNDEVYFKRGIVTNAHNRMLRAAVAERAVPAVNTNLFVPTACSVEYLLGLLNSRLATYVCTRILNTSIGGLSAHLTPEDIRLIPLAEPSAAQQKAVEDAVARIVAAKSADLAADVSQWEASVDGAVNAIYGLSKGAIAAVNAYWDEIMAEQISSDNGEDDDD